MSTLRDRVRESLDAGVPDERAAKSDLDAVLARANGTGPRPLRRLWPLATALAVAVLVVYLVLPRRETPRAISTPPASTSVARGVHLYLHVTGEPADQAIALDLDSKGDL